MTTKRYDKKTLISFNRPHSQSYLSPATIFRLIENSILFDSNNSFNCCRKKIRKTKRGTRAGKRRKERIHEKTTVRKIPVVTNVFNRSTINNHSSTQYKLPSLVLKICIQDTSPIEK